MYVMYGIYGIHGVSGFFVSPVLGVDCLRTPPVVVAPLIGRSDAWPHLRRARRTWRRPPTACMDAEWRLLQEAAEWLGGWVHQVGVHLNKET